MHIPLVRPRLEAAVDRGVALPAAARRPARTLLAAAVIAIGAIAGLPSLSGAQTPSTRSGGPTAKAALSQRYVKEEAHLHLSSKSGGSSLIEQGSGHGTFDASVQIDLTIKISKVTGSFVAYLKGGSISGYAWATPHFSGQYVSFKGALTIKHGSGRYAGASGTASLYGAINRVNEQLTVQVVGRLRM